jgi:phosphate transport system substrate-binding protein
MDMKITKIMGLVAGAALLATTAMGTAHARDQIQIVGSSTVFPFSTAVAEQFGQKTSFKTPVVESTGSGGGMKLFCAGVGEGSPDITNSSRRIKENEFKLCLENGVTPVEVKIGFDGIVLANSKAGPELSLTREQIFLALAKEIPDASGKLITNPHKTWADVDPSLPNIKIEVLGPPPTSGTRDAFAEIALEGGAKEIEVLAAMRKADKNAFKKVAHSIREDGAYIEAGENDNLIIQKLEANSNAFGVFGFSFLDQNADKVKGATVNGVEPEFENIAAGDYKISRSLFFYVKKEHVGVIPGLEEFVAEFTDEETWGEDGYLADKGLIPLPDSERESVAASATSMVPMSF